MSKNNSLCFLSALNIYPIKSCKGIALNSVTIGKKGPGLDRRWVIVDANGRFMSQRQFHQLALVETQLEGNSLVIQIPNEKPCRCPIAEKGQMREVTVWNDTCLAVDQGDEAAEKLSRFLQTDCRLVYMPDTTFRQVNQKYAPSENDDVGFADGYPFLLISEASLDDINSRLTSPVPMNRFRPNLVIRGCKSFEEDSWSEIRIGEIHFKIAKPCSRCIVTTIDQNTGIKGTEPLQMLATYRKQEKGIMFGQNIIHKNLGTLTVGAPVEIIS